MTSALCDISGKRDKWSQSSGKCHIQRSSVLCIFALLAAILLLSSCASAIGSYQPVAAFTANVTSGTAPLTVSFTDQSSYSPTSWSWNFGDGQSSNVRYPTHTYVSAGTYSVTLTVTNFEGSDSETRTGYITVTELPAPISNFTVNVTSGTAPLTVSFTDQSVNTPTSWLWNFGDEATSTSQNPTHTYTNAGIYTVILNATNTAGSNISTQIGYITVTELPAPISNFTANVTSGTVPVTVSFTDQSANTPTSWSWNFGDSNTSTVQNPTHTYTSAGSYTVTLNASNVGGSNISMQAGFITVTEEPSAPLADFTADVTSGTAPLTVSFTDQSANTPTSWTWDFGDGGTSTSHNPAHTYTSAGTYTVILNATNAAGSNISTQTGYITVTSASSGSSGSSRSGIGTAVISDPSAGTVTPTYTAVNHILGGSSIEYDLSGTGSPVLGITFDAKDNEGLVTATVQVLSDRPAGISVPPGNPYQLMSINVGSKGTISGNNADNILIHFKVSREWIEENNIDPSTIRMTRYNDGKWEELATQKENEDEEYLYFVAETPGFSIFSVVGDEVKAVSEEAKPVKQEIAEETPEEPVTEEGKETPGFTAAMGLVFVSVAFIVSRRSR